VQGVDPGGGAPHADEQSRSRGGRAAARPRGLRRHGEGGARLAVVRRHLPHARSARRRRDAVGAVREAGRRVPDAPRGAAGADRQREPGRALGQVGGVSRPGAARSHHVRPDDGRVVDLHRDAGDPAGHLRDVRRRRPAPLRGVAAGPPRAHGGARRDGRGAAARRDDARGGVPRRGGGPRARAAAPRHALPRPQHRVARRSAAVVRDGAARRRGAVRRADRQLRRRAARAGAARLRSRRPDRPNVRARPAQRLRPSGLLARAGGRAAAGGPGGVRAARDGEHRDPRARHAGAAAAGRRHVRLRQQHPHPGRRCRTRAGVRDPGVRARVHPAAVLRRERALPLGGAVGRGAGSAAHRPAGAGAVPGERPPAPLDRPGAGSRGAPGPAGAHLLAGPGRAGALRLRVERPGEAGRARGAGGDRPRPSRHRVRRITVPRDRGNARRVGRDRGLADPERAPQHRVGRGLGVVPPRRRHRHRQLAACGAGERRRRDAVGRAAPGARAHERSGDRHRAPRGRRLPGGARRRPPPRHSAPHARGFL